MVILSVCAQSASMATKRELMVMRQDRAELELLFFPVLEGDKGRLPVVATVFDKLNQVYKEYLEAEQSYAAVSEPQWVCVKVLFLMSAFCRRWGRVPVEAARPRSVRSGLRPSLTSPTCTRTSCPRSPRGR